MKVWSKIGIGLCILGFVGAILITLPQVLSTRSFVVGPLRASIIVIMLMVTIMGFETMLHVKEKADIVNSFYPYRSGYLLWAAGHGSFVISLVAIRYFGFVGILWQLILLATASLSIVGLLKLLHLKVGIIRERPPLLSLNQFFTLQEKWSAALISIFGGYSRYVPAAIVIIVLFQFLLFRMNITYNFAPFFAATFDQSSVFKSVYQAVFAIRDNGLLQALRGPLWLKVDPRGWLMPSLGLLFALLFGPTRLSVASVNFLYFACGQAALWVVLRRWKGLPAALLGVGLFLYSRAYFAIPAGGMTDLRFDFAGMITLGISFLSLVLFIENPTYKKLFACLLIFQVSVSSRSITIVYILGVEGLLFLYYLFNHLTKRELSSRLRFVFLLIVGTILVAFVFVIMEWYPLNNYYGAALRAGESPIRDAELGLESFWERPAFYRDSFSDHFDRYLPFLILAISGWFIKFLIVGKSDILQGPGSSLDSRAKFTFGVFLATSASFLISASMYAPSPVVASVLTIPLVFLLSVWLVNAFNWLKPALLGILTSVIFILGSGNYITAMIAPGPMPYGSRQQAQVINEIYADISNSVRNDTRIYWMFIDHAFSSDSFTIYWYESFLDELPPNLKFSNLSIRSIPAEEIINEINLSNMVIAPINPNPSPWFDYPYNVSVTETKDIWGPVLSKEFTLEKSYLTAKGKVGLYVRKTQLLEIYNPNGLEQYENLPFFWMGGEATEIRVRTDTAGKITFVADLIPGPSLPETNIRNIRVSSTEETMDLVVSEAEKQLLFTIKVDEGENIITILSLDKPTIKELPNGDQRPLMLGVLNLRILKFTD